MTTTWTEDSIGLSLPDSDSSEYQHITFEKASQGFSSLVFRENARYEKPLWIGVDFVAVYPVASDAGPREYFESLCVLAQWMYDHNLTPDAVYGFSERLDTRPNGISNSGGIVANKHGVFMTRIYSDGRISERAYEFD